MLKVDTEYLENRQARLTVSVDEERLQKELKSAASRISARVNIPGFRKGKAPYQVVARYVGDEYIYEEALEPLGQAVYKEALEETGIEPYSPGMLDEVSREPLVLTFTVPLPPEVDLGAYRDVRVPFETPKITDHDVEHAIDHLLDEQATLEPVDRAVEWDDVAVLDIKSVFADSPKKSKKSEEVESSDTPSTAEGAEFLNRSGVRVLISKKATYPVPGFPAEIVGIAAGESRSFDVKLPAKSDEIAEELRGRKIHFDVTCNEVFNRDLPELDDEFAQSAGDYADLADLRVKLRERLERDAEYAARNEYTPRIFDELIDKNVVKVSYPPVVVDQQVDDMIEDFERQLKRQGMNLDDYLNLNNSSRESLREDFRESAEGQVKRGLILGKLCEVERLEVTDDDIEDEIQTQLLAFGAQASLARSLYSSPEVRRSLANRRMTDKGLERLAQIARGEAPSIDAEPPADAQPEEAAAEKPKRKRAPAKKKEAKPSE